MEDNIDVRITLSSLFVDVDKSDEAIVLLSPPNNSGILSLACSMQLAAFVVQFFFNGICRVKVCYRSTEAMVA